MAVEIAIEQGPQPGKRILRLAVVSDIHNGIQAEDNRYLSSSEWGEYFAEVNRLGASHLVLGGDISDKGSKEKGREIGEVVVANFHGDITAVGGNHDTQEVLSELRSLGIHVLDSSRRTVNLNGVRIGMFGQNGSLDYIYRGSIRNLPWEIQTPLHHEYTGRRYHPKAVAEINKLAAEGMDIFVGISHVPLYPQQISDAADHPLLEMTPKIMEFIEGLDTSLKIILSGHTHSFGNPEYGRKEPITTTESGTVLVNHAFPNTRRTGGPQQYPITVLDIYQLPDGSFKVEQVDPVLESSRGSESFS